MSMSIERNFDPGETHQGNDMCFLRHRMYRKPGAALSGVYLLATLAFTAEAKFHKAKYQGLI